MDQYWHRSKHSPHTSKSIIPTPIDNGKLSPIYFPPHNDCSSLPPFGDSNETILFHSPTKNGTHKRKLSEGTLTTTHSDPQCDLFPPYPTRRIENDKLSKNETLTPVGFSSLLSTAAHDGLMCAPDLEEAFDALKVNSNQQSPTYRRHHQPTMLTFPTKQRTISPLPSPANSNRSLVAMKLISPDYSPKRKQSTRKVSSPPLKKRMTGKHHFHILPQQGSHVQQNGSEKEQPVKRISMTVPNLLMELKHNTPRDTRLSDEKIDEVVPASTSSFSPEHGPMTPLEQPAKLQAPSNLKHSILQQQHRPNRGSHYSYNISRRRMAFVKSKFPLPALRYYRQNQRLNKHPNKAAPSLRSYRRQWDLLSNRKAHISEHRMNPSERRQLLRESFGKVISRSSSDLGIKYKNKSWLTLSST